MRIEDAILDPFIVNIDSQLCFTVCKKFTVVKKDSANLGKVREESIGYASSIESALRIISRMKMVDSEDTISLNDYLLRLKDENEKFDTLLKSMKNV